MEVEQLILPAQCCRGVLQLAHTISLAGHLGKDKTAQQILKQFYWPTVLLGNALQGRGRLLSQLCNLQKIISSTWATSTTNAFTILSEPFKCIAMDIIGPLPCSCSGKRYVLVICDYTTRYPEAIPLYSTDASHIAEELIEVFARVGIPSEILTDQGSNFTSQLLTELYRMLHIHSIKTTLYHPQTDGLVERFNHILKSMLRKAATNTERDWDKMISFLLFAHREVPQSFTRFSSFELLYGKSVRGQLDGYENHGRSKQRLKESVVSYVLSIRDKLNTMYSLVANNLKEAQKVQKTWYDRNAAH